MHTKMRHVTSVSILMILILQATLRATAHIVADGRAADTVIHLKPPILPSARVHELAYADNDRLIMVREPDPPIWYSATILTREGDVVGAWPQPPAGMAWRPQTVASDRARERVFFSLGDAPLYLYDPMGRWLGSWRADARSGDIWPRRIRLSGTGTVLGLVESTPPQLHRWDAAGKYRGVWDPRAGQMTGFDDYVVDEADRILLIDHTGDGSHIRRFEMSGQLQGKLDLQWPAILGPAPIQQNPIIFQAIAVDHRDGTLLVHHYGQSSHSQYVIKFKPDGRFVTADALWRMDPRYHPQYAFIEPHPTDGYAIAWTPDSRVDGRGYEDAGVSQFDARGRLVAVTRTSVGDTFSETWPRARLAGSVPPVVLFPHSAVVGSTDSPPGWRRQAPPFAMDVATAGDGAVALRGWDDTEGTVTLFGSDKRTVWSAPCECPLATGIAIDSARVYISDPLTRAVLALRRSDGSADGHIAPPDALAGWPVDIASPKSDELVTIGYGGDINLWSWGARLPGPRRSWQTRGAAHPIAIASERNRIAVLLADSSVEVWTTDGAFVDRWAVNSLGQGPVVDIALDTQQHVSVLDAGGPAIQTFADRSVPVPEVVAGDRSVAGICRIEGDKVAAPSRVQLGSFVTVTLTLRAACPPVADSADVVIAWDPMNAFWYDYAFARTQEAVEQLVTALSVPSIRSGVVGSFSGTNPEVIIPLGTDLMSAVNDVRARVRFDFDTYKRFLLREPQPPDLIAPADQHLIAAGRKAALPVIVLVGEGVPPSSRAAAEAFVARGGKLFALRMPRECDPCFQSDLKDIADIRYGVHATDVAEVARRIQGLIDARGIRDVQLEDSLADEVQWVPDSASPPARVVGGTLRWDPASVGSTFLTFAYRVKAVEIGRYPTNKWALAHYSDADGIRRTFEFPRPEIEVFAPVHTPTPLMSPPATVTATATSGRGFSYFPLALRERCTPAERHADAVLVLDASSSMRDVDGSGHVKLAAAVAAARTFVGLLDLDGGDQAAVVQFHRDAITLQSLTADRAALDRALASIRVQSLTCLVCGVEAAATELASPRRRATNSAVVIVLTDGRSNPRPASDAVTAAARLKATGVTLFTIGLGDDVDTAALSAMAAPTGRFAHAPTAADLETIYADVAGAIPCPPGAFWGGR
ncbi:MAG: vWA domain-containing protein [Nitrospirota bacterium]